MERLRRLLFAVLNPALSKQAVRAQLIQLGAGPASRDNRTGFRNPSFSSHAWSPAFFGQRDSGWK